jgi:acyl carrier protein
MKDHEIIDLINTTLGDEFELEMDEMRPEATLFDDLGLDSLDMVDMVIVLETAFQFKVRDEEAIRNIRTLGDIHDFVISRKNEIMNQ